MKIKKLVNRLLLVVIGFSFTYFTAFLVLKSEANKRDQKYNSRASDYANQLSSWEEYKKAYDEQVALIRDENTKAMQESKSHFESLLAQQPAIIREHTRVTAQSETVASNKSSGSSSKSSTVGAVTNTTTVTKVVKVSKPASTPVTSAS